MPWSGYILFYIFVFSVNTFETPNSINMEVLFYFLLVSKTSSLLLLLTECPRFTRFICWNPVHKVRILGSMALGRCSWGVSPHERDSYPFKKRGSTRFPHPFYQVTKWGEDSLLCVGIQTLIRLNLPVSWISQPPDWWEINVSYLSHAVWDIFVVTIRTD